MQCDGQNLLTFAASSKALDVGEFIISTISKNDLAGNIKEIKGKSMHLASFANERMDN